MAGTYQPGVPDPTDTSSASTNVNTGFSNFDDLTQFGVSPNIANIPVPWKRSKVTGEPPKRNAPLGPQQPLTTEGRPMLETTEKLDSLNYQDAVRYLYGKQPPDLEQLQLSMAAGGFYGTKAEFINQTPDTKTRNAWNQVLQISMRSGKTPDEVIQGAIDANGGLEEGLKQHGLGSTGRAQDVSLTHPDDIRMVAKETSRKILGKSWSDSQIESFIKTYHSMEQGAGAGAAGVGATYTQAPSLAAAAEAEAQRSAPVAAQATSWDNAALQIMNAFKQLGA